TIAAITTIGSHPTFVWIEWLRDGSTLISGIDADHVARIRRLHLLIRIHLGGGGFGRRILGNGHIGRRTVLRWIYGFRRTEHVIPNCFTCLNNRSGGESDSDLF